MPYMDKLRVVYSVDGEERTIEVDDYIDMVNVLGCLAVGTLYRVYGLRGGVWTFLEQHKTQPPPRSIWAETTFPD